MAAVSLAFELIVMISIGVFARRSRIIDDGFEANLTSLLIHITLPCMIVQSLNVPFSISQLHTCAALLGLALLLLTLYFILGHLMYVAAGQGPRGRIFRFGIIFTNFTFMGLPVMESLYGQEGLFAFVIFIIPFRLAYYSSARPLLTPAELRPAKPGLLKALGGMLSPPVAAAILGLILYVAQVSFPAPIAHILSQIGGLSSPLGMLLCGISLGGFQVRAVLKPRFLALPAVRNLLLPTLTAALMLALPADPMVKKILVVFSALPVASLLSAFTIQYDSDPGARLESAGSVFFSTLASALTVPMWAYLAERLF